MSPNVPEITIVAIGPIRNNLSARKAAVNMMRDGMRRVPAKSSPPYKAREIRGISADAIMAMTQGLRLLNMLWTVSSPRQ